MIHHQNLDFLIFNFVKKTLFILCFVSAINAQFDSPNIEYKGFSKMQKGKNISTHFSIFSSFIKKSKFDKPYNSDATIKNFFYKNQ